MGDWSGTGEVSDFNAKSLQNFPYKVKVALAMLHGDVIESSTPSFVRAPSFRPTFFVQSVSSNPIKLGLNENWFDQNELDEK